MQKKHAAVLAVAAAVALGAVAFFYMSRQSAPLSEGDLERCKLISVWANGAMSLRQEGDSMSMQMDLTQHEENPELRAIRQRNIQLAYEQKRYDTRADKDRAISEFESAAYLACLKNVKR